MVVSKEFQLNTDRCADFLAQLNRARTDNRNLQAEKLDLLNTVKLLTEKVRSQQDAMEIEERK
jgi:hypothetical protein